MTTLLNTKTIATIPKQTRKSVLSTYQNTKLKDIINATIKLGVTPMAWQDNFVNLIYKKSEATKIENSSIKRMKQLQPAAHLCKANTIKQCKNVY
jgi:hypothetical protein